MSFGQALGVHGHDSASPLRNVTVAGRARACCTASVVRWCEVSSARVMIDSVSPIQTPRANWHCLVAADEADVAAEFSYHVLRLGFSVSTIASDADVVARVVERVPQLVVASAAVVVACGLVRRELREATGNWGLGLVVVRSMREPVPNVVDRVDTDAIVRFPAPARETMAALRRAIERMTQLARRTDGHDAASPPFAVRREAHEVRVHDRWVSLSAIEFHIVEALLRSPGGLSAPTLEHHVWGGEQRPGFRGLITVMARLRKKLAPYGAGIERVPELLGYRLRW
jgi:DNA-binding response OmpR family regulator